ncbi:MAG: hypothetical protein ABR502_00455 [Chitinophagaceae bacterium]
MKIILSTIKRITAIFILSLISFAVLAQEGGGADVNVDINKGGGGGNWYAQPWVWIVGGALFILLLVALLRGNGSRRVD